MITPDIYEQIQKLKSLNYKKSTIAKSLNICYYELTLTRVNILHGCGDNEASKADDKNRAF